jgi:hypothetical protein
MEAAPVNKTYERPRIETLSAEQIVECLGPVSCGSSPPVGAPGGGGFIDVIGGGGSGHQDLG